MKLGLDIHGVLDHNPELFTHLAKKYVEIHIITGGSFKDEKYDLVGELLAYGNGKKWWTHEFSVYDHLMEIGAKTNEELGIASHYPFPDETWNKIKAEYCAQNGIDLHIDDMAQYLTYFTTPYMLYKDPNRKHRDQS